MFFLSFYEGEVMKRLIVIAAVLIITFSGSSIFAGPKLPFAGKISASKLNIRSGPGPKYAILGVYEQGREVTVTEEKDGWYRVDYPKNAGCYIYSKYVDADAGVITGDNVNVRAGASLKHRVVCMAEKGEKVQVLATEGEWCKITAPKEASAWASAKYVEPLYNIQEEKQRQANVKKAKGMIAGVDAAYEKEMKKSLDKRNINSLVAKYKKVAALRTGDDIHARAQHRISLLNQMKKEQAAFIKILEDKKNIKEILDKRDEKTKQEIKKLEEKKRGYAAQGWIEGMGNFIGRPATHKLTSGGKMLFFVKSDKYDLDAYAGKLVGINGKISQPDGWETQVIDVTQIDILYARQGDKREYKAPKGKVRRGSR